MAPERIWRKSSYSTANGSGDCVEVSLAQDALVRDTKNASPEVLAFSATAWRALINWL
ncbi:DUF397 domain-containing protein [Lentzea sp.]|uniref:DUF397 domain-containing protein n=1 Tax=Lentzea sp. TaxID=56099 RepID=UPI002CB90057|nr:DUF397 domain-containing protein [Lentzea sp.]HUQ56706.1 DUF397 domain-containing protein [Lentzea sp.]